MKQAEEAARLGVPLRRIYMHIQGCSQQTFWNWMDWGKDPERQPYATFVERVQTARAEREGRLLMNLDLIPPDDLTPEQADAWVNAAVRGWQRTAWVLERSYGYHRDKDPEARPHESRAPDNMDELLDTLKGLPLSMRLKIQAALELNDAANEPETAG